MKSCIVIPARIGSTRFPQKPLALLGGKPMIQRVYEVACSAVPVESVYIATDSAEIEDAARSFGAQVVMTSEECKTGSDRVLEAVECIGEDFEFVINLQGDAPLFPKVALEAVISSLSSETQILTPAIRLRGLSLERVVGNKRQGVSTGTLVTSDKSGRALYFSKGLIPHSRDGEYGDGDLLLHLGLYAYRIDVLKKFCELEQTPLELLEKLEQLRALENGIRIDLVEVDADPEKIVSVDRPEDLEEAERILGSFDS